MKLNNNVRSVSTRDILKLFSEFRKFHIYYLFQDFQKKSEKLKDNNKYKIQKS